MCSSSEGASAIGKQEQEEEEEEEKEEEEMVLPLTASPLLLPTHLVSTANSKRGETLAMAGQTTLEGGGRGGEERKHHKMDGHKRLSSVQTLTVSHSNPWKYTYVSQPRQRAGVLNRLKL